MNDVAMVLPRRDFMTVLRACIAIVPSNLALHRDLVTLRNQYDNAFLKLPEMEDMYWRTLNRFAVAHLSDMTAVLRSPWALAFMAVYNDDNYVDLLTELVAASHSAFLEDSTRERFMPYIDINTGEVDPKGSHPMFHTLMRFRTLRGEMRTGWVQDLRINKSGTEQPSEAIIVTDDEYERRTYFMDELMCWLPVEENCKYAVGTHTQEHKI